MGAFIARQPNGLLCRFSSIVDAVTDYNMTEEEFIQQHIEDAKERAETEAKWMLKYHIKPFEDVKERFQPREMTQGEFDRILKEMEDPYIEDNKNTITDYMTAEDTLQYMSDFYSSIFPTRKHALNHLFCVIGNGYDWVEGRLVDCDDKYERRYKLQEHIKHAEFEGEAEWNRFYQIYKDLNVKTGSEIPMEFNFQWYPLSKDFSAIYTAPEDIKPDWKLLLEECKQLLISDGIFV